MKTLKVMCAATILALSLSIPAAAGDSHSPGGPNPILPPPAVSGDSESAARASAANNDGSVLTLLDIMWALASMY